MLGELSNDQINNLLSSHVMGRLACTDGEKPYIVPITYTYDGEYIYGQTNFGKKLKMLRKYWNTLKDLSLPLWVVQRFRIRFY